jgi:glycosyltransferase involved in cell wall biosynthesis
MRIAIDARELTGRPTGVGRYLSEILAAWTTLPAAARHEFVLCAAEEIDTRRFGNLRLSVAVRPGTGTLWEQSVLPRIVRSTAAEVLFSPAYTAPLLLNVPSVVVIHDVSFAAHPEWFTWHEGARRRVIAGLSARRARRVLTISAFSKREIATRLRVPADRITVIYPGLTRIAAHMPASAPAQAGEHSILFVGSIFNRRHVPELIEGFAIVANGRPDLHLEIVGENRTSPHIDLDATAARHGVATRVHMRSYDSDEELARLYARATGFAFLSEYEGFGLTPLEALGAGIPVLVLDTPIAREIYGEAAVYATAPAPDVVARGLEQLLDAGRREALLREASRVVARYRWDTCAAGVLEVLTSAA